MILIPQYVVLCPKIDFGQYKYEKILQKSHRIYVIKFKICLNCERDMEILHRKRGKIVVIRNKVSF